MANQIKTVVKEQPYSAYEMVQERLEFPRGSINMLQYSKSMSYGQYQKIDCDYEPFVFDNLLNRIIKYCVRLLISKTSIADTQNLLNEIIFLLDEVEDLECSIYLLSKIQLPSIFQAYEDVLHCCKMILENKAYSYSQYELKNWSLLFPMEYVFEDFIAGFIKMHFSKEFIVEPQKSELYLHESPNTFNLKHDILLTNRVTKESIIIDTKYKTRSGDLKSDPKKGVSQQDLYQMISYAFKRGTDNVIIIYPNSSDILNDDHVFHINSRLDTKVIQIKIVEVPFWSGLNCKAVEANLKLKLNSVLLMH
jgi:5-methylcytosine-specific restriction enzyme subunit McrC